MAERLDANNNLNTATASGFREYQPHLPPLSERLDANNDLNTGVNAAPYRGRHILNIADNPEAVPLSSTPPLLLAMETF